jgi:hypothetical protein
MSRFQPDRADSIGLITQYERTYRHHYPERVRPLELAPGFFYEEMARLFSSSSREWVSMSEP